MSYDFLLEPANYIPLFIAIGTYLALWILKNIGIVRLRKISIKTTTIVDDLVLSVLEKTRGFFMLGTSLYVGFQAYHLDKVYGHHADRAFIVLTALQVIIWGKEAVNSWIVLSLEKKNNDPSLKTSLGFVGLLIKFVLISIVLLFALNNLGFNISTFIAGLGVGGIAIALATQNILGDLFSSLSIVLDKPFIVGDFVSLGEWMGTVEHIGLKTTRIRSISGEQIVISNTDLLSSKIRNFKRMEQRRVVFQLGVTYATKRENLRKAPGLIKEIICSHEKTRFDRANFISYGAYSLDIEVAYFVMSSEYTFFADTHEKILLDIHEAFEANDLDFAFPTQSLILERKEQQIT
jgi:small-conductance mechanosensitive channel